MKLEMLRVDELVPYENNPRKNDEAVEAVAESIRQCTYITPIIVDENRMIIAGHTRYKALKSLGIEEVQCLVCDSLTNEQKKKYRFLDNKTGEKAVWDFVKLEAELDGIDLGAFDFFGTKQELELAAGADRKIAGSTEYDTEVFGDDEFRYQCPKCGYRFN